MTSDSLHDYLISFDPFEDDIKEAAEKAAEDQFWQRVVDYMETGVVDYWWQPLMRDHVERTLADNAARAARINAYLEFRGLIE